MSEQHRLNGNAAFKANNYEQSIDLYTKSVMLDNTNSVAYMNRAIACELSTPRILGIYVCMSFRL